MRRARLHLRPQHVLVGGSDFDAVISAIQGLLPAPASVGQLYGGRWPRELRASRMAQRHVELLKNQAVGGLGVDRAGLLEAAYRLLDRVTEPGGLVAWLSEREGELSFADVEGGSLALA